jgi:hypothetical protein
LKLLNLRRPVHFRYIREQNQGAIELVRSDHVRFQSQDAVPLQVHLELGNAPNEYLVTFVTNIKDGIPSVELWSTGSEKRIIQGSSNQTVTYRASDLCEEPATRVTQGWFAPVGVGL